jgi:hypothetical protein
MGRARHGILVGSRRNEHELLHAASDTSHPFGSSGPHGESGYVCRRRRVRSGERAEARASRPLLTFDL